MTSITRTEQDGTVTYAALVNGQQVSALDLDAATRQVWFVETADGFTGQGDVDPRALSINRWASAARIWGRRRGSAIVASVVCIASVMNTPPPPLWARFGIRPRLVSCLACRRYGTGVAGTGH